MATILSSSYLSPVFPSSRKYRPERDGCYSRGLTLALAFLQPVAALDGAEALSGLFPLTQALIQDPQGLNAPLLIRRRVLGLK